MKPLARLAGSAWLLAAPAWAQQAGAEGPGRPTMAAVRLAPGESIVVDGRLDEPIWERVVPATDFIQQDPSNGSPATERTEVRIAYTAEALYMGVTGFDSEPSRGGFEFANSQTL